MLSIHLQAPGIYAACDGERTLGLCRFEGQGEVTVVTGLTLESGDSELCDGLLRAALFFGLRLGRPRYRIEEAAAAPHRELLRALEIPEAGQVQALPSHCRQEH